MRLLRIIGWLAGVVLVALAGAAWCLDRAGVDPRTLARHVGPRSEQDNALRLHGGSWAATTLATLERRSMVPIDPAGLAIGAHAAVPAVAAAGAGRLVAVSSAAAVRAAVERAAPGDVIALAPGAYRFAGASVALRRPGSAAAPITLRAASPGTVVVEFDALEGFAVSAPYWRFEHLSIKGACRNHSDCEHAFHVVGDAHHFAAVNNTITDFNAHFKINGSGGRFPDHGTIEANTLTNSSPRRTANPVTPIDLVAASGWTIRRNLVADFVKQGGDQVSYGAFAKGGGARNVFEQNIVWCERLLRDQPGQRVGMSLGGGGSGQGYCREGKCITEQDDSVIASNLIAACSDDGIYLNSAARTRVFHNTLVGTGGIALRFPATSADIEGNLVDGPVRVRDGAIARQLDNLDTPLLYRYLGYHPNHGMFAASLAWRSDVPRRAAPAKIPADLCGVARPATPAYGAFEEFSACRSGAAGK